jgi:hypothetical protein
MSHTQVVSPATIDEAALPLTLLLEIRVTDAELVRELIAYPEGRQRDEFALCALRIGLLALKQARGQLDGDTIQREGERLLNSLEGKLSLHAQCLNEQLTGALKDYFDPESGRFQERIQRLVKKDGELEEVLRRQIGQQDSELCKTLTAHVGAESALMRMLSPKDSEGLFKAISDTLTAALADQRKLVLTEFSLDNPDGALSRLVKKLTDSNGDLSKNLQTQIDDVIKEFSLDEKDSALSRLVRRVTKAQKTISAEFSLDNDQSALSRMSKHLQSTSDAINNHLTLDKETSALSRLKRELTGLLDKHSETNQKFQEEVKKALGEMKVRREELQRSPEGGKKFEQIVHAFVQSECQRAQDIVTFTGDTVGAIKSCKVGDTTIEIGPEHVAAGARIVVESKQKEGVTLQKARNELDVARKNRETTIGVFVFAKDKAPEGQEPFQRIGDDLFVVWNPDDPQTDIYLQAGLTSS